MTSAHNEMLTRDVCEVLDVTPSAVSRMVARGDLKPKRVLPIGPGVFVFRRRDVEKLAAKRSA
jgi:hypothetical protein